MHELLPDRQSAYRRCYSTEAALLRLFDQLHGVADARVATALLFLDLSAAFDTIDHQMLLDRLSKRCGVADGALAWFSSYLSTRTQSVRIGELESPPSMMQFGVPQGPVLGSTLFISYNSSLPSSTRCDLVEVDQFSDDTSASSSFQLDAAPA
jgi:hypothetical protein